MAKTNTDCFKIGTNHKLWFTPACDFYDNMPGAGETFEDLAWSEDNPDGVWLDAGCFQNGVFQSTADLRKLYCTGKTSPSKTYFENEEKTFTGDLLCWDTATLMLAMGGGQTLEVGEFTSFFPSKKGAVEMGMVLEFESTKDLEDGTCIVERCRINIPCLQSATPFGNLTLPAGDAGQKDPMRNPVSYTVLDAPKDPVLNPDGCDCYFSMEGIDKVFPTWLATAA